MSDGRTATYLAFGAAILATLGLGFSLGSSGGSSEEVAAGAPKPATPALELPMTDMAVVEGSSNAPLDRDALGDEIKAYLLANPEVIMQAVAVLEERRVVEEAQGDIDLVKAHSKALFDDGFSFVGGNPEGSITLVEFQDYRCGFCKRAHSEVQQLVAEDGDIRLIVKEFPILGPDSVMASELAIATIITQGNDAYKRLSDALMTFGGPINDAALTRIAKGALVDLDQSRAAMKDPEVRKRIDATHSLGRQMNITGTPTFVIGEKIIRGYLPKAEMAQVVALSRRVNE